MHTHMHTYNSTDMKKNIRTKDDKSKNLLISVGMASSLHRDLDRKTLEWKDDETRRMIPKTSNKAKEDYES